MESSAEAESRRQNSDDDGRGSVQGGGVARGVESVGGGAMTTETEGVLGYLRLGVLESASDGRQTKIEGVVQASSRDQELVVGR